MATNRIEKKNESFRNSVKELLSGLDSILTTRTTVGEPIQVGDTTIVPFSDVEVGMGAGVSGGGMGTRITPNSVLIIKEGAARIISIKDRDTVIKVLDMVPEVVDRIKLLVKKDPGTDEAVDEFAKNATRS